MCEIKVSLVYDSTFYQNYSYVEFILDAVISRVFFTPSCRCYICVSCPNSHLEAEARTDIPKPRFTFFRTRGNWINVSVSILLANPLS